MASAVSPEHRFARHGIVRLDLARHHLPIVRRKKTPYGWNRACRLRNASRNQVDDLFFFLFETLLFFLSPARRPSLPIYIRSTILVEFVVFLAGQSKEEEEEECK